MLTQLIIHTKNVFVLWREMLSLGTDSMQYTINMFVLEPVLLTTTLLWFLNLCSKLEFWSISGQYLVGFICRCDTLVGLTTPCLTVQLWL